MPFKIMVIIMKDFRSHRLSGKGNSTQSGVNCDDKTIAVYSAETNTMPMK